jgi:hypothetical protein
MTELIRIEAKTFADEVLDISQPTDAQEIKFPQGINQITAILTPDNSWTI